MVTALALLAATTTQPSTEALRLGRQIAENGNLAAILPLVEEKEAGDLVAAHPELGAKSQAELRATAKRVYEADRTRLMKAEAESFARKLSMSDLRSLAAFARSSAARRLQSVMPQVVADTMQQIGQIDFKGDVLAAYCKETGKLCGK